MNNKEIIDEFARILEAGIKRIEGVSVSTTEFQQLLRLSDAINDTVAALKALENKIPLI